LLLARDVEARFAEPVDQVLDQFRIPPKLGGFLARHRGEVWSQHKQLPQGVARRLPFAELSIESPSLDTLRPARPRRSQH